MTSTLMVATQADLLSALAQARGGETILLAPGDYGDLQLAARTRINITYASEVTIASADAANPAVFTGLSMRGVSNLTFDGVTFDYRASDGAPIWTRPFQMTESDNITIRNSTFDGDLARGLDANSNGYATGIALGVRDSHNITIENNTAFAFSRGFVFASSDNLVVAGNDLHALRIDGMNFSGVQGVLIADNHIHDFALSPGATDHCDMIQFWTNGTTRPSADIMIRNNTLDIGTGGATQSIFMRNDLVDRGLAGPEMFYRNVTITENVIVNGHSHGITVGETRGLVISHNSVLQADAGNTVGAVPEVHIPKINVSAGSMDVAVTANVTSAITGHASQPDWTLHGNAYVQNGNPLAPGHYGDVFVSSTRNVSTGAHDFVVLPGGMIHSLGAGATSMLTPAGDAGPLFHITGPQFSNHLKTFDASIMGPQPAGTTYLWDFGDGTTATGPTATHAYATGGQYDVTLSLRRADGSLSVTTLPLSVANATFLRMESGGGFAVFAGGTEHMLAPAPAHGSDGLHLGASGVAATVGRAHVAPLLGATDVTFAMTLTAGAAGATGEVARLHGSFIIGVNQAGEVEVSAWSSTGQQVKIATTGFVIDDLKPHDIELRLSGGQLTLWVDGTSAAGTAFVGTFADVGTHGLVFGNPWAKPNFRGDLSAFSITLLGDTVPAEPPVAAPSRGPDLLRLDASGGFEVFADGERNLLHPSGSHTDDGLQLGAPGVSASVARAHLAPLFGATQVTLALSLAADVAGATGEVARLHNAFVVTVTADGNVMVHASSAAGQTVKLATKGIAVNDTSLHDIKLCLSDGRLDLWVDGRLAAGSAFDGGFADAGRHDLTFGNPWGKTNFNGDLGAFSIQIHDPAQPPDAMGPMRMAFDPQQLLAMPDGDLALLEDEAAPGPGLHTRGGLHSDHDDQPQDIFSMLFSLEADPPLV
ncbi:MAG: right-handed parallel beta-helix repeat-containing protein [Gemmobacter sp.]